MNVLENKRNILDYKKIINIYKKEEISKKKTSHTFTIVKDVITDYLTFCECYKMTLVAKDFSNFNRIDKNKIMEECKNTNKILSEIEKDMIDEKDNIDIILTKIIKLYSEKWYIEMCKFKHKYNLKKYKNPKVKYIDEYLDYFYNDNDVIVSVTNPWNNNYIPTKFYEGYKYEKYRFKCHLEEIYSEYQENLPLYYFYNCRKEEYYYCLSEYDLNEYNKSKGYDNENKILINDNINIKNNNIDTIYLWINDCTYEQYRYPYSSNYITYDRRVKIGYLKDKFKINHMEEQYYLISSITSYKFTHNKFLGGVYAGMPISHNEESLTNYSIINKDTTEDEDYDDLKSYIYDIEVDPRIKSKKSKNKLK